MIANYPKVFRYEGICYYTNPANNTQPLYRFYNRVSASHFYTASLDEANHILATWPNIFTLDGPTYAVNPAPVPNSVPVYRFFNLRNGSHFYTASAEEADMVIATWPTSIATRGLRSGSGSEGTGAQPAREEPTMRRRWTARIAAVVIGALMLATMAPVAVPSAAASAAPYAVKEGRLYQPVQSEGSAFGWDVDISGDTLVVGAPWYSSDRGAAYVFVRSGASWVHQATLQAPAPAAGDEFGYSVAIDGDIIVVGAPWDVGAHGMSGSAYAFRRTGVVWSAGSLLPTELEQDGDQQGLSVDFDGHWAVVGCPGRGAEQGAVRPIEWTGTGWDSHGGVTLTGGALAGDRLGGAVAVSGDTILAVSAQDDYDVHTDAGSVIAYSWSGAAWMNDEKIYCPTPVDDGAFATSIDLNDSGTIAVVGWGWYDATPLDGTFAGRAYIYTQPMGDWDLAQTIANPNPDSPDGEHFGWDVALDDSTAVIGGFWDDAHLGAAYAFLGRNGTFTQQQKITVTDEPLMTLYFGRSVALDGGVAVIGADGAYSPTVDDCGAAFVYNANATITGICRDAGTGLPLAGVEIQAHYPGAGGDPEPASDYVLSGADGRYTLKVPSAPYYLNFLPGPMYQAGWYNDVESWLDATPITVAAGNTYNVDFTIYPKFSVFRFFNVTNNTHFFTNSLQEKNMVLATWPAIFRYEGIAYTTNPALNRQPLYRFYNRVSKSHFYTASLDEANHVIVTWSHIFTYDGPTYSVSPIAGAGMSPVHRFYNLRNGSHFYTASTQEADMVIATWPDVYRYEGPAFWVGGSF